MKNIIFCVLLLLKFNVSAQIENLIKDPKIGWIAQTSTEIGFDIISPEATKSLEETNQHYFRPVEIIKFEEIKSDFKFDGYNHFAKILFEAVYSNKVKTYTDSTCTKEVNILNLNIDTIIIIDPITYEATLKVAANKFDLQNCVFFKVFQTFIYKPQNGVWEIRSESIAPVFLETTDYGTIALKTKFWIKVDNNHISDKNSIWKVRTQSFAWQISKMNEIKKSDEEIPLSHFVNYFKKNYKIPFYSDEKGWNSKSSLTQVEKTDLFKTSIDTFPVKDPLTQKNRLINTIHSVDSNTIRGIKFVQEWYWDKRKNSISSKLLAIAPLLDHVDAQGNFLYQAPLFFVRFGK